ncbi:ABC transporter ATP-binding protein [Virgisporangium ochraceum]|uniref:ABC transporter ATP-binding protein n=1 Tax=Virgisporangium ochraceum TaxID=65505 RepID=A0A8J4A2A9_9ACTN|nr:ABC transporter ATP-binding protein [Virgisporangium ochraceum]GIJ73282.1 ABC transporter ATP-binding protein [Virgisporangium ochraceum]
MPQKTRKTTTADAVRLTGLTKRFGAVTAVDGVDLGIDKGEVVALLGPNGAGKSTTIDLLLGLARPDAGTVTVYDLPPDRAVAAGRVGAMLQSGGLLPDLTVGEMVTLAASLYRTHRPVPEVLERAGLDDLSKRRVGRLSGGQRQRVRFAMALVADPDLIVLDEPTTGLDVEARRAFWTAMRAETAKGRTVLFATHYLDEADAYADRVVLMRQGQVIADGSPAHVKSLVSGRTIRATVPGAHLAELAGLPGVDRAETRGSTVLLTCTDSDAALRALLTRTQARDVEVSAHGLEDAFLALTAGGTR